jgi:hypothetical protein
MARPERFELPTDRFVADYSIQLSYGRLTDSDIINLVDFNVNSFSGGERGVRTLDGS